MDIGDDVENAIIEHSETGNSFFAECTTPFISVIVMAYNRREFLKLAIESVINQTLCRSLYEVILVKNFKDDTIDQISQKWGIEEVLIKECTIGEMIECGVRRAKGSVLSFLDDDDLFFPEKIEKVFEAFMGNPRLVYYRNEIVSIDEKGSAVKESIRRRTEKVEIDSALTSDTIGIKDFWVLSSISVRSSIFGKYRNVLKGLLSGQDLFISYLALIHGGILAFDVNKLTKYRIHANKPYEMSGENNRFFRDYTSLLSLLKLDMNEIIRSSIVRTSVRVRLISITKGTFLFENEASVLIGNLLNAGTHKMSDFLSILTFFVYFIMHKVFRINISVIIYHVFRVIQLW